MTNRSPGIPAPPTGGRRIFGTAPGCREHDYGRRDDGGPATGTLRGACLPACASKGHQHPLPNSVPDRLTDTDTPPLDCFPDLWWLIV